MSKNRRFDNNAQQENVENVNQSVAQESVVEEVVTPAPVEHKKEPAHPKKGLQSVFNIEIALKSYIEAMGPGRPITSVEGGQWQYSLYQAIMQMISVEPQEEFNETLKAFLRIVKEQRQVVFHAGAIYRFPENFPGGPEEYNKFRYLIELFITTCDPTKRSSALNNILLDQALKPLTETQRNSLINFYSR